MHSAFPHDKDNDADEAPGDGYGPRDQTGPKSPVLIEDVVIRAPGVRGHEPSKTANADQANYDDNGHNGKLELPVSVTSIKLVIQ